ncbi:MAG: SPOR domain-containing protein [Pseudomonadota bacterium]
MSPSRQRISARDYKHGGGRGRFGGKYQQFAYGLAAGLAVALAVFIFDHRGKPGAAAIAQEPLKKKSVATTGDQPEEPVEQYDFYDMLPKFEVVLPEERNVRRDLPSAPISQAGSYVIQAGSFNNESEASRRQQQLAKLGIGASVQRVAIDADVKHRVRIGPLSDLKKLNGIRDQLHTADIDILLIKVPD